VHGTGVDRSTLPQRLRAAATARGWTGRLSVPTAWATDRFTCAAGADHRKIRSENMALRFQLVILASQMCEIFRLTILNAAKFDNGSKSGALTKMSLSSDVARGNTERLAGGKGSANLPARLFPRDLGLLLERPGPIYETAPGDSSPFSGA
jgi:hypothetical protein